ncbi:MAG: hypothetical protein MUE90_11865 [Thermoanaerobaculales bacterium]|nr:hypothetical protein [Thermoanaerobaculales bacterium]
MRPRWRRLGVLLSAWVAPALGAPSAQELRPPPFGAEIEVRRVLTEVRVVGWRSSRCSGCRRAPTPLRPLGRGSPP